MLLLFFSYHLGVACGFRHLVAAFVCCHHGAALICVRAVQMRKVYPISNNKLNQGLPI